MTDGPIERPTQKLSETEIQKELLNKVLKTVEDGFARTDARFDAVEANQELQGGQVLDLGRRMTQLEGRVGGLEEHRNVSSMRAKEPSQHDIEIRTELGEERKAREALALKVATIEAKTDEQTASLARIEKAVTGVINNPKVQFLGRLLFIAAAGYAAAKGIKVLP